MIGETENRKSFLDRSLWYAIALFFISGFGALIQASHDGEHAYRKGDYEKAFVKLNREANAGDFRSHYFLGWMYQFGYGVPQNDRNAFLHFYKAAMGGHVPSQTKVGYFYDRGIGTAQKPDDEIANGWYKTAANSGDEQAQYNLGLQFEFGRGLELNLVEAANWYEKAANQSHSRRPTAWDCYIKVIVSKTRPNQSFQMDEGGSRGWPHESSSKISDTLFQWRWSKRNHSEALQWHLAAASKITRSLKDLLLKCTKTGLALKKNSAKQRIGTKSCA